MTVALKETCWGPMLYLPNDRCMGKLLSDYGEYGIAEIDLLRQIVRPGDIVIDAGANIGCLTLPLARLVGRDGMVVAFEPQRTLYYTLCGNLALNGLADNVMARPEALGSHNGTIKAPLADYDAPLSFCGISMGGEEGEDVPMITVDSIPLPALRLLKADVEGMETEVLRGARDTIRKFRPFLYVENDRKEKAETLVSLMRNYGYRLYWHKPRYLSSRDADPELRAMVSLNVLGVPEEIELAVDLKLLDRAFPDNVVQKSMDHDLAPIAAL